jgi:GH35 family endo-1,4-beta-xylanase
MSFDEFNQEVYEHISALSNRYRDQIDIWNVINEAHGRSAALDFSREEITALTNTGIRAIRENAPDARIIINDAFDWYGESRTLAAMMGGKDDFTLSIPAYLDQLEEDGVDYDIIGQQLYNGGYVSLFSDWGLGDPMGVNTWDLAYISALLDRLGEYGKPVHITEQSVPSSWESEWEQYGSGWWHRHWDEETQAEFVHDFYTIAFSKERIEAITWWCINDNDSFIFTGGLLDTENNPKPAYYALRDLITGWMTAGQGETDAAGRVDIQGYGGEYELTVTHDDQTWRGTVHIWEQQESERVIQMTGDVSMHLLPVDWYKE